MHEDERGKIQDLMVGDKFSVTHITFKKGAVRGNHYHKKTVQHDIVIKGRLLCVSKKGSWGTRDFLVPGMSATHQPSVWHAYEAREDSEILSICYGTRIGEDYSKDTFKLRYNLL